MRRCPVCGEPGGFHDVDDPGGFHAAARARIPAEKRWPSANEVRRRERAS